MPLIKRTQPTSDRLPPWIGLAFTDRIGTDEFYEHLKKTYPKCSTQWERKHMAAIDFLLWELRQAQSPSLLIDQSQRSLASPDTSIHPNDIESSHEDTPASSPTSSEFLEISVSRDNAHPTVELKEPLLPIAKNAQAVTDGMTQYVFNAADLQTYEPRKRRKMSPAEKKAYKRMRRRGGACDKCRRNKEKCVHNMAGNTELSRKLTTSKDPDSKSTKGLGNIKEDSARSSRPAENSQSDGRPGELPATIAPVYHSTDHNETQRHLHRANPTISDARWTAAETQGTLPEEAGAVLSYHTPDTTNSPIAHTVSAETSKPTLLTAHAEL